MQYSKKNADSLPSSGQITTHAFGVLNGLHFVVLLFLTTGRRCTPLIYFFIYLFIFYLFFYFFPVSVCDCEAACHNYSEGGDNMINNQMEAAADLC